jgi:hypothetical protein
MIMSDLAVEDPDETILNIARWAANNYQPYEGSTLASFRWQLAYSGHLPRHVWPSARAVDLLVRRGYCNQLVNALQLMARPYGIQLRQFDIVLENGGHSALAIRRGDDWAYIDPFYGWAFKKDGRLLSFKEMGRLAAAGHDLRQYAIALRSNPGTWLYNDMAHTVGALSGDPVHVAVRLPLANGPIQIGRLDGKSTDVIDDGTGRGVTSHLYYIGPKHFSDMTVDFISRTGGGFSLTFHLLAPPDPHDLPIANVIPDIHGSSLTYRVPLGLRLDYTAMRRSYGTDMIEAAPLAAGSAGGQ